MKLKNKKTGEIVDFETDIYVDTEDSTYVFSSIADLNEHWEDAPEEPKLYWYIDDAGVIQIESILSSVINMRKSIGNYFNTREEAEKAVEKLKAWKRLRDKGFKVDLWDYDGGNYQERIKTGRILFRVKDYEENDKDLDLLFSQEDD